MENNRPDHPHGRQYDAPAAPPPLLRDALHAHEHLPNATGGPMTLALVLLTACVRPDAPGALAYRYERCVLGCRQAYTFDRTDPDAAALLADCVDRCEGE